MNNELLQEHIANFLYKLKEEPDKLKTEKVERDDRILYYQSWTKDRMLKMTRNDLQEYVSKLWAMLIWGNKEYKVDQMIEGAGGLQQLLKQLADIIWGTEPLEVRWDKSMKISNGIGAAMRSELLCHVYPNDYMIWNRRAFVGFSALGIENLPRYNYQLNGKKYLELSEVAKEIALEMKKAGAEDTSLLAVDYFIWEELQGEEKLSQIHAKKDTGAEKVEQLTEEEKKFVHNDVRDAIRDIGQWLGFNAEVEKKVADGSVVDAVWESSIGNMGRVMYVFEVQTKGNTDSLILNLLKARNNPAVQGVVAVSDTKQLEKIQKHAASLPGLGDQLKFWDYEEVLQVHESLEFVNGSINKLNLVPEGF